jgi:hypothetical protein
LDYICLFSPRRSSNDIYHRPKSAKSLARTVLIRSLEEAVFWDGDSAWLGKHLGWLAGRLRHSERSPKIEVWIPLAMRRAGCDIISTMLFRTSMK